MYKIQHIDQIAEMLRNLVVNHLPQHGTSEVNAVITQLIGSSISYSFQIPAEAIAATETVEDYYNRFYRSSVTNFLSALNEEYTLDTSTIQRIVVQMWLFRYRLVHDPRSIAGLTYALAVSEGIYPEFVSAGLAKVYADNQSNSAAAVKQVSEQVSALVTFTVQNPETGDM